MKKALLLIGGLSVLGVGLYVYFKKQAKLLSDFTWKIVGFKIKKVSLTELNIDVTFRFMSQSDIEAKVNRLYLDMYLENKNVGYISEGKAFIIPANGSSDIPINISVNPQVIFKNIIDLTLGVAKKQDVMFKFDGFANVKSGFLSTTIPIKYETSIKEYLKGIVPTK
jgi:LEA14-like dessication related protein